MWLFDFYLVAFLSFICLKKKKTDFGSFLLAEEIAVCAHLHWPCRKPCFSRVAEGESSSRICWFVSKPATQRSGEFNIGLVNLWLGANHNWMSLLSFSSPRPRLSSSQSKIDSGRWSLPIPSPRKIPALILKYVCVYVILCGYIALLSFVYVRMRALIRQAKHTFSCKNQHLITIFMASISCSVWTAWCCVMLVHCRTLSA